MVGSHCLSTDLRSVDCLVRPLLAANRLDVDAGSQASFMEHKIMRQVDAPKHPVGTSQLLAPESFDPESFDLQHLRPDCDDAARCIDELLAEDSSKLLQTTLVIYHPSGEVIEQVLRRSAYASIRAIKAHMERNVVLLQGNVPSFYHRQLALAAAMKHMPGTLIIDFIEVDSA